MITHQLLAQSLNIRQEAKAQQVPYAQSTIGSAVASIINAVMVISVITVLIFLIMGGYEWITSGGEKGKVEAARSKITSAIFGIVILAASIAILMMVQNFLKIEVFKF